MNYHSCFLCLIQPSPMSESRLSLLEYLEILGLNVKKYKAKR